MLLGREAELISCHIQKEQPRPPGLCFSNFSIRCVHSSIGLTKVKTQVTGTAVPADQGAGWSSHGSPGPRLSPAPKREDPMGP